MIRLVEFLFVCILPLGLVLSDVMENRFALTMANFSSMRIDAPYDAPVVIMWPSSDHPVLVTSNNESVRWNPIKSYTAAPFTVIVDYVSNKTMFTVPASGFEGKLYYFCENHEGMGVHEMFVHAAHVIDINRTLVTVDIVSGAVLWGREVVLVAIIAGFIIGIFSTYALYHATAEKNNPESELVKKTDNISQYDKIPINDALHNI